MARDRSIEDRVADWLTAFTAIEGTLNTDVLRGIAALAVASDPASINIGWNAARQIYDNARTAAIVAEAMTHVGLQRRDED